MSILPLDWTPCEEAVFYSPWNLSIWHCSIVPCRALTVNTCKSNAWMKWLVILWYELLHTVVVSKNSSCVWSTASSWPSFISSWLSWEVNGEGEVLHLLYTGNRESRQKAMQQADTSRKREAKAGNRGTLTRSLGSAHLITFYLSQPACIPFVLLVFV